MSYNNNYNGAGRRYGYNQNYSYNNYENNRNNYNKPKKKSGCKSGIDRNGKPYIQGWKADKTNGLRKFYASPYKNTQEVKSKKGKVWQNWFVRITMSNGEEIRTSGMFDVANDKLIIPQLSFIMNPKGGYGGYVGPAYYKKNR